MHGVTISLGSKYYKKFKNLNNIIRLSIYEKRNSLFSMNAVPYFIL